MAWLPFKVWWRRGENQQDFWRTYENGVAISLGETPRYIFRQILQRLKEYHDQNVGYGNLLQGMLIGENKQVFLANDGSNPNSPLEPLASIRQDFLDFKELVAWVETLISTEQCVQQSYSSRKFHELFMLLDDERYNSTVDGLRRFGFFIRNNPLFYDDAAKFLFFRKVLTILEYSETDFHTNVKLLDLQDWSQDVRNTHLLGVRDFKTKSSGNPTNQSGNPTSQNVGNPTNQSGNPTSQNVGNSTIKSGTRKKKRSQSGSNQRRTRGGANNLTYFLHIFSVLQDFFVNLLMSGLRKLGKICNLAAIAGNLTSQNGMSQSGNATSQSGGGGNLTSQNGISQSGNATSQSGGNLTSQNGMSQSGGNLTSQNGMSQSGGNATSQSGGNLTSQSGTRKKKPRLITYEEPDGSILFFRNCLGHLREQNVADRYHDAKILLAVEDNLPKVIPVWFHDLVKRLDLDELTCKNMCGYSWMEFLSMHPTAFT